MPNYHYILELAVPGRGRSAGEGDLTMTALIYRMIIAAIAGKSGRIAELYEAYARERRLHVTVAEILQSKRESA